MAPPEPSTSALDRLARLLAHFYRHAAVVRDRRERILADWRKSLADNRRPIHADDAAGSGRRLTGGPADLIV